LVQLNRRSARESPILFRFFSIPFSFPPSPAGISPPLPLVPSLLSLSFFCVPRFTQFFAFFLVSAGVLQLARSFFDPEMVRAVFHSSVSSFPSLPLLSPATAFRYSLIVDGILFSLAGLPLAPRKYPCPFFRDAIEVVICRRTNSSAFLRLFELGFLIFFFVPTYFALCEVRFRALRLQLLHISRPNFLPLSGFVLFLSSRPSGTVHVDTTPFPPAYLERIVLTSRPGTAFLRGYLSSSPARHPCLRRQLSWWTIPPAPPPATSAFFRRLPVLQQRPCFSPPSLFLRT